MSKGKGLADLIRDLRLRADGVANHLDALSVVGLAQKDVDLGQTHATRLETLDAEQEALKAQLKAKTAEIEAAQKQARQWRTRVTKLIKVGLENDPETWVEFGIDAKH